MEANAVADTLIKGLALARCRCLLRGEGGGNNAGHGNPEAILRLLALEGIEAVAEEAA